MRKILCVGRGYVATALERDPRVDVVSRSDPFVYDFDFSPYAAIINCAGIVGDRKCSESKWQNVRLANVVLPHRLLQLSEAKGLKFIQPSTVGVYIPQTCEEFKGFELRTETDNVEAYNAYVKSKLEMEEILQREGDCYIFRMAWFGDAEMFKDRVKNWDYIQDTYTSICQPESLLLAIKSVVDKDIDFGLYNISSMIIYFPDYISKLLGRVIPRRTDYPETMTSSVPVTAAKALSAGIELWEKETDESKTYRQSDTAERPSPAVANLS